MIFSVVLTLLALSFMVVVHELGHMLTAKRFGALVHEFSVGMGPKLFSVKKGETAYTLRLLPIGGYVSMEGEQGDSDNPRAFGNLAWWKRLVVLAAGAVINVAVGWALFAVINCFEPIVPAVVDYVPEQYEGSVFKAGDELLRVNGSAVHTRNDVSMSVSMAEDDVIDVLVRRGGERLPLRARLYKTDYGPLLGVVFKPIENPSVFTSARYALYDTAYVVKAVVFAVRDLIVGRQSVDSLSGPVEIVSVVDTVAESGAKNTWLILMDIFALIAVNLGVFNLLPVPGLDGGQMLFVIIEKITGKKIKPEVAGTINLVFFALLAVLAAYVTFGDVMGIINK